MQYVKGSEWRKWDLHFHTPSSGSDYGDQSVTNEQIVDTLLSNHISAVAITDHHIIDVDRYLELRKLAKNNISIFPGIELRSELGGRKQIHFIGIFPEDLEEDQLRDIWIQIQGELKLTPTLIRERGGEDVIKSDFEDTCQFIHKLGGLISVHAGSKTNTIEELRNSDYFRCIQKKELTLKHIDIIELGKKADEQGYREHVFPAIGTELPLIITSDNHSIKNYPKDRFTWIKADTTFEGLKQTLYESKLRVEILEDIPESKLDYLVIDKVRFNDPSLEKFANEWIELNPNLNSIIGGKSSGKSLLLYHIANTISPENTNRRIKSGDNSIRYDYRFTPEIDFEVQWRDGVVYKLSDGELGKDRSITFIPQLYLNALAEKKGEGSDFKKVIESILVGEGNYAAFLSELTTKIDQSSVKLHSNVSEYLILRKSIIEEKDNLKSLGDKDAITQSIASYEISLKELREESKFTDGEEAEYEELQLNRNRTKKQLNLLKTEKELLLKIQTAISDMSDNLLQSIVLPQLLHIRSEYNSDNVSLKTIDVYAAKLEADLKVPLSAFGTEQFGRLAVIEQEIRAYLEEFAKFEGLIKLFEARLVNKTRFEKMSGEQAKEVQKLKEIQQKELDIIALEKGFDDDEIFSEYQRLLECYFDIILELEQYKNIETQNKIELISEVTYNHIRFEKNFSAKISKKTTLKKQFGNMFGEDENEFIFRIDQHVSDVRKMFDKLIVGSVKLNRGFNLDDVVHALLDNNFFIEYDLKQGNDTLLQMSPGKRGIILFQLFLHLSNSTTPILIDQPEDNLDNRTVYRELNNFIKRKKLDRQIIIVSHNANLVVSTDSEEIIVANQHGENKDGGNSQYCFEYVTGALENKFEDETKKGILYQKGIRNHVCEILEGGEEAFKKREKKYALE